MAVRVPEADEVFRDIVASWAEAPDVETKRMFGSLALTVGGRIACFANGRGSLVAKLPAERVEALTASRVAAPWAMQGRRMREWTAVPLDPRVDWFAIAAESIAFLRAEAMGA